MILCTLFYSASSDSVEKLQNGHFTKLLDGFYKMTIEGHAPPDPFLVKVTGTKLEYYDGTQKKGESKIEYGQVLIQRFS